MIGNTLAHYRITAKLGEGGMGEVYRATDTRLGREVAIKVLPAEMAGSQERLERFRREAQALAALDHPGIITVYSVEEADGVHFLTMQLVDGEPLDHLITEEGIGVDRLVMIGTAIAEALAVAHARGIVHRDLKPANVMVAADGRVKVLDFGLAKIAQPTADAPIETEMPTALLTREGVVMGTVPYMSPEQIAGRALDSRTDIFSLGVLLYEMASGQLPFAGQSSAELASAILRDRPGSLVELRGDLPPGLAQVIEHCLEKDPEGRFSTARELCDALTQAETTAPVADRNAVMIQPSDQVTSSPSSGPRPVDSGAARAEEGFWVAVLPFKYTGQNADVAALAEGLSEEVVTGLSRFSYLRVIARSSVERYADGVADVRSVGEELGARYVMEGSIRQAGSTLRIAIQLVDAVSGAHLWAESYRRAFDPDEIFEVQDDIASRIVCTVADMNGILPHSMGEVLRHRDPQTLSPYEAVLRGFGYLERITPDEHAEVRGALERAVEEAPDQADAWAMLSMMYAEEHKHDFNVRPGSLDRALEAARRAVSIAPSNHLGYHVLAQAYFFRRELQAFRPAAERAVALNPMDGCTMAFMGNLMGYTGDWEHGCALAEQAMELNPHHPGWYRFPLFSNAFRQQDYRGALDVALKFNMPSYFFTHAVIAAAYGKLGEREAAQGALKELLALKPDFSTSAREEFGKWYGPGEILESVLDGLRKAGLDIPEESASEVAAIAADASSTGADAIPAPVPTRASGAARAEEGFWVAVLPFRYTGTDTDIAALAEGLCEEIVTGLSRFSYLRVIARSTTERFSGEAVDARSVGREIGARYVLEASLRHAGRQLRLAVQLADLESGAHLWAESYNRDFDPDQIFALQDEIAPRIVSTIADTNGVLPRSMSEAVRSRDARQLSPYEAVLRSFAYFQRVTADELAAARAALELAVAEAPDYADAWALLAILCGQEYGQGFDLLPDPLAVGAEAAQRAVEVGPSNPLAYFGLAQVLFFQKEFQRFRNAAERAVALNPMDGNSVAFMGELLIYTGDYDRGLELAERAKQLNPNHPDWYWYADFYYAFRQGDDRSALGFLQKVNLPGHWGLHAAKAASHGNLGESSAAKRSLEKLLKIRPDFAATARQELEKWWEPEYVERFLEGLRKAGLAVPSVAGKPAEPAASSGLNSDSVGSTSRVETPVDRIFKPPPTPATPLLGRDESLAAAAEDLQGGARVLTITGYGGTGKTRFAIELFDQLASDYVGGAAFVSLAAVTAASEVLPTVAIALDIAEAQGRSALDALSAVIANRRVLLVLDNLEQVVDAASELAELAGRCPALQVVATSRAPLKIGAESEFSLPPLELPPAETPPLEDLMRSPAVALLLQRAEKVRPGFELTPSNAEAIAAICRHLDGLPLALELAAARLRILEPDALLVRLDHALDLLTSGDRDLPQRQRTLRATLAWSYSLLDPEEQRLLRQLAVFQEGWALEAMEQICYREKDRHRAVDELDSLVEKGLVRVVDKGKRYALLETIREFAAEQLEASGETAATESDHTSYYLGFAARIAADLRRPAQCEAMSRARDDHANLLAAARRLVVAAREGDATALEDGLLLCGHLNWFWHIAGHHMTGRALLDELLALAADVAPSRGRALAWLAAGMISTVTGEWERSLGEWQAGYEDGVAIGDEEAAAEGMMGVGYCHLSGGRLDEAAEALEEATSRSAGGVDDFMHGVSMTLDGLRLFVAGDLDGGMARVRQARRIQERLDDCEGGGFAVGFLAQMTSAKGDHERALALYRESLALFERVGDLPEIARVLCETGWTALAAEDEGLAQDAFRRAVLAYEAVGSPRGTGLALLGLAAVDATAGRPERAVTIAAAADALSKRAGIVVEHPMAPEVVERIEVLKASIPQAELEDLVADGRALSPAEVLTMIAD